MLISNIAIVFQIYRPKYPNKTFLVPLYAVAVLVVVVLLDFWYLDKLQGTGLKYGTSLSNFSLKVLKKGLFGPNLRIFIFVQNFPF